jgi:hypothetical protein
MTRGWRQDSATDSGESRLITEKCVRKIVNVNHMYIGAGNA